MANSVDPHQMQQNAASDLGLHCLQRSIKMLRVIMVIMHAESMHKMKQVICTQEKTHHDIY